MLKRLGVVGAVVAVAALATGSVGPAVGQGSASRGGDDDHRVLRVVSVNTEEAYVDAGEPDFSLGDSFVFSSVLKKHGKKVGHAGVECTLTSVRMEATQCVATAWFRRGQITVQGLLVGESEVFSFPITGGSGAFEGAEGTLVVRELSETKELLTFHLED